MRLLLEKHGLPEEGDLVLCIVSKIHFHSIFVNIIEYGKLQGMIHISEVSPGRIRNIRDFVKEGKTIVCKILRTNIERHQVDLSLRRVTESQKRIKVNEIKQEQVAEAIIEFVAKANKLNIKTFFEEVLKKTNEYFDSIFDCFYDVVESNFDLNKLGLDKVATKSLEDIIRQRIKPVIVEIKGHFKITSYLPNGVDIIREALMSAKKINGNHRITYKGAGHYDFYISDKDYKKAEAVLTEMQTAISKNLNSKDTFYEMVRT